MRIRLFVAGALMFLISSCNPTIYKAGNFENSRIAIKRVAILPFVVSIDPKRLPKGATADTLKIYQVRAGYNMQKAAYTWMLSRQNKYSATIQNIDSTNALWKNANIPLDSLSLQDKGELCRLLNVDAVISGNAISSRPMSDGAAIAVWVLVGGVGTTNKKTVSLSIHNSNNELLWKYHYVASGGLGTTSQELTRTIMKNASKRFPYKTN